MRDHQQEIKEREKWQPLCGNIDLKKKMRQKIRSFNFHLRQKDIKNSIFTTEYQAKQINVPHVYSWFNDIC